MLESVDSESGRFIGCPRPRIPRFPLQAPAADASTACAPDAETDGAFSPRATIEICSSVQRVRSIEASAPRCAGEGAGLRVDTRGSCWAEQIAPQPSLLDCVRSRVISLP